MLLGFQWRPEQVPQEQALLFSPSQERLQALDTELPGVVARLETLQDLHSQTATFAGRLHALEEATGAVKLSLESNEAVVKELEKSVCENAELMAKNMQALDAQFVAAGN